MKPSLDSDKKTFVRGIWRDLELTEKSGKEASTEEVGRAIREVVNKQAGVLRLLETE